MPRVRVTNRWFLLALSCALVLAGVAWGRAWWSKSDRRATLLAQSRAAYNQRDWPTAQLKAFEQLKTDRDDPVARRLLARALYRQGRDQDAAAIFERLPPDTMEAEDYLLIGQAYINSQKTRPAREALQKAVALDPNHFEARVKLEQIFFRLDRLADADREAERLLAQPGREAAGELMRGQIRVQISDPAGAVGPLERALAHPEQWEFMADPNLFRKLLARSLLRTGQPVLARGQLRQLTGDARDPETCWLLSRCDLQEAIPTEAAVSAQAGAYRDSHPMEPEPAPFVGEVQCAKCHATIFRDQSKSRHARTFFRKEQVTAISVPQQPLPDPSNAQVSHAFHKRGDGLEVQTRVDAQVYQTIVDYAFGSGDRGLTLVGHDQEGRSLEYRLSLYPDPVGWDVTTGQTLRPNQTVALYQGKPMAIDDVRHCMDCHHTHPLEILTGTGRESSDRAIGCERCHGPGGNHLKVVSSKDFASNDDADLAIGRPSLASGPAIVGLCAECHSQQKTGIKLKRGSPEAVRFQAVTLTWSRCYEESGDKLDCMTCHNPHRNAETSVRSYESRCLQCHSSAGAAINRAGNPARGNEGGGQTSCPVQPASGCIGCHMPRTETDMAHTPFTDHFIRVHRASDLQTER